MMSVSVVVYQIKSPSRSSLSLIEAPFFFWSRDKNCRPETRLFVFIPALVGSSALLPKRVTSYHSAESKWFIFRCGEISPGIGLAARGDA